MTNKARNKPYKNSEWQRVRAEVLNMDHYECQRCKGVYMPDPTLPKRITRAVLVHHHFLLENYPQWKYQIYVTINGVKKRNLYSLCNDCHEEIHKATHRKNAAKAKDDGFTTPERWD